MTTYEIIDPLIGSRWQGKLEQLSKNLKVNALLCSVSEDGAQTSLGIILHRDIVLFALQWAKSIVKPTAEVLKCLELTEKWLEDEDSVTKEELRNAAVHAHSAAAYAVAHAVVYAAHADTYAYVAAHAADAYTSQGKMIVDYYASSCADQTIV